MVKRRKLVGAVAVLGLGGIVTAVGSGPAMASSHREAPLISQDPVADLTDVYAFVSPDKPDSTTFVMNVIPFEDPSGGPNFYKFGDDVKYTLNIDNNGDANPDIQYDFRFTTSVANPGSFLYNTNQVTSLNDPDLNVKQTYTVTETSHPGHGRWSNSRVIARNLVVPPANVGVRSTPNYEANLGAAGVNALPNGGKVFAGPRDDPFFADLGAIFDLAGLRPFNSAHLIPLPTDKGRDDVAGKNVHSIAIQLPTAGLTDGDPVLGVWATTSRRQVRVLSGDGDLYSLGRWVQTARLGNPLVNEVVVPIGSKDKFNASQPQNDLQFVNAVLHPELGKLIPILYPGVKVPTDVNAGLGTGGREDLATIFLTGIPGVNKPKHVAPSEMLRLNTSTPSAFPNGRALTDDVVDGAIRAVAGATAFTPAFNISPNKDLGDGVDANDKAFTSSFPYLAAPFDGYSRK